MATRRNYRREIAQEDEDYLAELLTRRAVRARERMTPAPRRNFVPWFIVGALIAIIGLGVGLVRTRPDLVLGTLAVNAPAQPTAKPTSTGAQRMIDAVNQQSTAAEQQTLQQAIPTADTSVPSGAPGRSNSNGGYTAKLAR
jgi:hypothetical protein